jgi:hypothetical protein
MEAHRSPPKSLTIPNLYVLVLFVSTTTEMTDRHGALLGRLADLGMSLAEDLHARALAAKDEKSANDLALAFHRISRSLRQTLALEARLERERKLALREAAQREASETLDRVQKKRSVLRKAVAPLAWAEHEGDEAEDLLEDMEFWVYEASGEDDFLDTPVEVLISRLREAFGLPASDAAQGDEEPETAIFQSG